MELASQMISAVPSHQTTDRETLASTAQTLATEYLKIANQGVGYLAKLIVSDLEPVFLKLFTPEWEGVSNNNNNNNNSSSSNNSSKYGNNNNTSSMQNPDYLSLGKVITATCADYFQDMIRWLFPLFYDKFVYQILQLVVAHYCMSVRRRLHSRDDKANSNSSSSSNTAMTSANINKFQNNYKVSELVMADRSVLMKFFQEYETVMQRSLGMNVTAATAAQINDTVVSITQTELMSLQYMAQILLVSDGDFSSCASDEIRHLFDTYAADGLRVVQGLIYCHPVVTKQERKAVDEFLVTSFTQCALKSYETAIDLLQHQQQQKKKNNDDDEDGDDDAEVSSDEEDEDSNNNDDDDEDDDDEDDDDRKDKKKRNKTSPKGSRGRHNVDHTNTSARTAVYKLEPSSDYKYIDDSFDLAVVLGSNNMNRIKQQLRVYEKLI